MNLLKGFTLAAAALRVAQALERQAKAQERQAGAMEQLLQIYALEHNVRPSQIKEALAAADREEQMELLEQSGEELARLAALERMAAERGVRLREDEDLEERLWPGPPGGRGDADGK